MDELLSKLIDSNFKALGCLVVVVQLNYRPAKAVTPTDVDGQITTNPDSPYMPSRVFPVTCNQNVSDPLR